MSKRGSVPIVRVELPFMTDLNPTLWVKVSCQRVSALAREADGAYTMIQRRHCKGLTLMSTKKLSGHECSPAQDLRTSACQRNPQIRY